MLYKTVMLCISGSMSERFSYYLFHKPYGCLSQFTKEAPDDLTLSDYLKVESNVYPVGRLDKDSEGLLLLTNDISYKTRLLSPKSNIPKTYIVIVEGKITIDAILALEKGVPIKINKKTYLTRPSIVKTIVFPSRFLDIGKPLRIRKNIPVDTIEITITEGKNRQIRRMCASVGFPVLRLIRIKFGPYQLNDLRPGEYVSLDKLG
jgi:23S rRNA pseudouridine2457 synthase